MGLSAFRQLLIVVPVSCALAACATSGGGSGGISKASSPSKQASGNVKIGKPYQINGKWYYPKEDPNYDRVGIASWYGPDFHGKSTANGEIYDQNALTAAHTTLPMPSYVRVTNLENNRSIILRINDRGPFAKDRVIDVSRRAAQLLGFHNKGTAKVRVQAIAPDSPDAQVMMAHTVQHTDGPDVVAIPTDKVEVAAVETKELDPPPASGYAVVPKPAGPVDVMPPSETPIPISSNQRVYVQAGAFSAVENAERLAAALRSIGTVELTPFEPGNGKKFFRVRLGPLASMDQADSLLGQVVAMGHGNARIVVE